MRINFEKGKQREFMKKVLVATSCPSLRELSRRLEVNYSTLKNYFVEDRTLPETLFIQLCEISGISEKSKRLNDNWGQVKGGKSKL